MVVAAASGRIESWNAQLLRTSPGCFSAKTLAAPFRLEFLSVLALSLVLRTFSDAVG